MTRSCQWCEGPIAPGAQPTAKYCRKACRQAAHRFHRLAARRARAGEPMRFGYADPPYPGKSGLYRGHPDYAGEVDHVALVARLLSEYPDGWALSTSAEALPRVLEETQRDLGTSGFRVAAWIRRHRPNQEALRPLSSWEPVIYAGGRPLRSGDRPEPRLDSLVCYSGPLTTRPDRVIGAKPGAFAYWLFDLLGALPGDTLDDLFPGSGAIGRAWARYEALEPAPQLFTEPGAVDRVGQLFERLRAGVAVDLEEDET